MIKKAENKPAFLKAATVAADLGVSQRTVCRLIDSGELPGFKLGGLWLVFEKEYREYIEAKKNAVVEAFLLTLKEKNQN
jgi:excisionase family DNA binding protein